MYENLRSIRKKHGLTCEQMAKVIDVKTGTYSKEERGDIIFSLPDAKKISDFFGLPVESIFFANELPCQEK